MAKELKEIESLNQNSFSNAMNKPQWILKIWASHIVNLELGYKSAHLTL